MKEENYEISSEYMRDLKKLLIKRKISKYDIAHASFRKNNAYMIIKSVDKIDLKITYLNGDVRQLPTYNDLMKRIKMANEDYRPARRKFIAKYYKIINAFTKHRMEIRRKNAESNTFSPQQIRLLASQI